VDNSAVYPILAFAVFILSVVLTTLLGAWLGARGRPQQLSLPQMPGRRLRVIQERPNSGKVAAGRR